MRILLDTHLLLWMIGTPSRLSRKAKKQIDAGDVYVSAASIWEISIKSRIGKLSADPAEVLAAVATAGFSLLPITGEHASKVAELPLIHKDPFDRMLIAQAFTEPMVLLTNDGALTPYGSLVSLV